MNRIPTLDGLRGELRSRWPEWTALSLYAALVAFAIPYHEPSADVAQAWQLARCLSLHDLFQTYIRYEGSPGLWHFLLWILIRARVSYSGLPWVCGALAVGAAALLIFKSPFPRYIKLVLPFTFFLVFQYAVIARSYVLVPILLFLVALWWKRSPVILALLLGLMANVALHATVISGALVIVYCLEQIRNQSIKIHSRRRQLLRCVFILLGFWAFALWTAWPPHDLTNYMSFRLHSPWPGFYLRALYSLVWAVCQPWILSIPFWIAIALCLSARRSLFYLIPVLFFTIFCGAVASDWWHYGLLFPLVICLLWITWPASGEKVTRREAAGRIALIAVAAVQLLWSGYALEFDHYNACSPDLATSEFLRPFVLQGATIAVTDLDDPKAHAAAFFSVGLLPYFDHNIYVNMPDSFWSWSNQNPTEERFRKVLPSHPSLVIIGTYGVSPDDSSLLMHPKVQMIYHAGYRLTHIFCGAMPEGLRLMNHNCDLIFQLPDRVMESSVDKAIPADKTK
jgi:hypothetical protein